MVNTPPGGEHTSIMQRCNRFAQSQALVLRWTKPILSKPYDYLFQELLEEYLAQISSKTDIYQEDILLDIVQILKQNPASIEVSVTQSFTGSMKSLNLNIKGYILSYQFKTEGSVIDKWEHDAINSRCAPLWFMYSIANNYFIAYENIVREYNQIQKRESLLRSNTVMKSGIQTSGTSPSIDPVITDVVWRTKKTLNLSTTSRVTEKWEALKAQQLNKNPTK